MRCFQLFFSILFLATAPAAFAYKLKMILPDGTSYAETKRMLLAEGYKDHALEIRYVTVGDKDGLFAKPKVESISLERWWQFQPGGRLSFLKQFYYASTREFSRSALKHVVCFNGEAFSVAEKFFSHRVDANRIDKIELVTARPSADQAMLGIQFDERLNNTIKSHHFRMVRCQSAGKGTLSPDTDRRDGAWFKIKGTARLPAQIPDIDVEADDSSLEEKGYQNLDTVEVPPALKGKVPSFELRADYAAAAKANKGGDRVHRPWKGKDLTKVEEAEKVTLMLLAYFYDGMANQDANPDQNLIAQKNQTAYWCHMPWLNVGAAGREGIHGLTNERPLETSTIYPDAPRGADWGIGFYNAAGCETINEVFGPADDVKAKPDFVAGRAWKDNTVSVKTLFTTARDPAFKGLDGAFEWHANVSEPQSNERDVKPVRMIQIDIALKDSSLKGMNKALGNWMMTTYYYDPTYDMREHAERLKMGASFEKKLAKVPGSMLHMRPSGIQVGFEEPDPNGGFADSVIFAGSKTNQKTGRLNGPADNARSSCLSCHGTAGTRVFMAPGFMNNEAIEPYRDQMLDFSQQLALAKRNYETRKRKAAR